MKYTDLISERGTRGRTQAEIDAANRATAERRAANSQAVRNKTEQTRQQELQRQQDVETKRRGAAVASATDQDDANTGAALTRNNRQAQQQAQQAAQQAAQQQARRVATTQSAIDQDDRCG